MHTKTILLSILFGFFSIIGFSQDARPAKADKPQREVQVDDINSVQYLIGIKEDQTLLSYKISLVNKGDREVFIWKKNSFDESRLADMIREKKSEKCAIYIENITVADAISGKPREYAPVTVFIK